MRAYDRVQDRLCRRARLVHSWGNGGTEPATCRRRSMRFACGIRGRPGRGTTARETRCCGRQAYAWCPPDAQACVAEVVSVLSERIVKWSRGESNPRPLECDSDACYASTEYLLINTRYIAALDIGDCSRCRAKGVSERPGAENTAHDTTQAAWDGLRRPPAPASGRTSRTSRIHPSSTARPVSSWTSIAYTVGSGRSGLKRRERGSRPRPTDS